MRTLKAALLAALFLSVTPAAPAVACTPHLESQGPTATIRTIPDPDVDVSTQGTFVRVITCLG